MTKFFKIKKKTSFGVIFAQREFFLKTLAMYNCRHLNVKDTEQIGRQIKNYFITIIMQKPSNQSAPLVK